MHDAIIVKINNFSVTLLHYTVHYKLNIFKIICNTIKGRYLLSTSLVNLFLTIQLL